MASNKEFKKKPLLATGQVQEQPFTSSLPVIGPIIASIRSIWNNIAAKWYIRPMLQQQNEFNSLILRKLQRLDERITDHEGRLIEDDRDRILSIRETTELGMQLADINRLLDDLENRLDILENES